MEKIFINAGIISIVYLLVKFMEMRIFLKENKPLNHLIKDTIYVYFSVILGMFIIDQLVPKELTSDITHAFVDAPGF
jgi:hypothetical protein